jgi:uncharacterized membrane protein
VFYFPLIFLFMLIFFGLLVVLFLLIMAGAIGYAFDKIGLSPLTVFVLFSACLIGSSIDIPVHRIRNDKVLMDRVVSSSGLRFRVPTVRRPETVVAVNVGGAVIPCLIALYLLASTSYPFQALIGVAIVTAVSKPLARPVPGLGIAMPAMIPPLVAALVVLILAPEQGPMVAYISGTFGVLIGADVLNLNNLTALRALVVSVGLAHSMGSF